MTQLWTLESMSTHIVGWWQPKNRGTKGVNQEATATKQRKAIEQLVVSMNHFKHTNEGISTKILTVRVNKSSLDGKFWKRNRFRQPTTLTLALVSAAVTGELNKRPLTEREVVHPKEKPVTQGMMRYSTWFFTTDQANVLRGQVAWENVVSYLQRRNHW